MNKYQYLKSITENLEKTVETVEKSYDPKFDEHGRMEFYFKGAKIILSILKKIYKGFA